MANEKKHQALGLNHGTASHRLKKMLILQMLRDLGRDRCFQCGELIENEGVLSVEHKVPWQSAPNPYEAFFDLGNVAFSHLVCNVKASLDARRSSLSIAERDSVRCKRYYRDNRDTILRKKKIRCRREQCSLPHQHVGRKT
jgi:hypothetical protein